MPAKKLRIHPKYKTKYRVTNWASYDRALVRRGERLFAHFFSATP